MPYPSSTDAMICPKLRPPLTNTPPIIRQGTQIMPPAHTMAMLNQLCRCSALISKPEFFCDIETFLLVDPLARNQE